jgi:Holliday junction resolvase RusA-like endonuclease
MLTIYVPGDPVSKGRPHFVRSAGRAFTPAKTARAERSVRQFAAEVMGDRPLFDEPLALQIDFAFLWPKTVTKRRRADPFGVFKTTRPDADNLQKLAKDALNGVVWVDDSLVALSVTRKFYGDKPGTTITVCPIAEFCWSSILPRPDLLALARAA